MSSRMRKQKRQSLLTRACQRSWLSSISWGRLDTSQLRVEMHAPYESLEAWIGANVIIRRICLEVKPNVALLDGPFQPAECRIFIAEGCVDLGERAGRFRSARRSGNHVFNSFLQVAAVTRTRVSLPQGCGKFWVIGKSLALALAFNGGVQFSLSSKDRRDLVKLRRRRVWIQFDRLLALSDGLVVTACIVEYRSKPVIDVDFEGIQPMRFADFSEAIVQQANCREVVRVPMMSGGIIRLEVDGSAEFPVAARPVPIDEGFDPAERCVSFGQAVVDLKRHASRLSSLWEGLCRGQPSVSAENQVGIGNSGVSVSVIWVLSHGLKKIFESRLLALSGLLPPKIAALEVKVMGPRVDHTRFSGSRRIVRRQFGPDLAGYGPSHVILQSEDVAQVALEALSPQVLFLIGVNQLRGDSHPIPRPEYRAFNDRIRAELARNFRNRLPGAFIARGGAARDHSHLGNLAQMGDRSEEHT